MLNALPLKRAQSCPNLRVLQGFNAHRTQNRHCPAGWTLASMPVGRAGETFAGDSVDMEYEPLPRTDRAVALAAGVLAAVLPPLLSAPPAVSNIASTARAALWACLRLAAVWFLARYAASEARQARRLVDPRDAAYRDSRFVRIQSGLQIHYLEETPPPPPPGAAVAARGPDVIIIHGFGSSAAACRPAMRPLADALGSRVIAFDMPGFGLTERPRRLADFDAAAAAEGLVAALGLGGPASAGTPAAGVILVGHSLGGLVAANLAARPTFPATAAVLVAPAVPATLQTAPPSPQPPIAAAAAAGVLRRAVRVAATSASALAAACRRVAGAALLGLALAAVWALQPLVAAALRRAVYRGSFWRSGLASAYGSAARPSEETLADYRRASRVRGWDWGLVRFVRFRLGGGLGPWARLRRAWRGGGSGGGGDAEVAGRLRAAGRPVLLVHGAEDRIVPPGNSRVLCASLGAAAALRELPRCGHSPLEEAPAEVAAAVAAFVAALPRQPAPSPPSAPEGP
jgi:pimeloyl-ACP methyl ester carboxylesterase